MKDNQKKITSWLGVLGVAGSLSLSISESAYAKKKKDKAPEASASTAAPATTTATTTVAPVKSVPKGPSTALTKPGQGASMGSTGDVGSSLGQAKSETLLSTGAGGKPQSLKATAQVDTPAKAIEDMKKKAPVLSLGVYRSENLSGGQVNAPGIADFAAYFRASGDGDGDGASATPSKDKAKTAAAAGPGSRDGVYKQEHTQLGSATTEQLARQAQAEKLRAQTSDSIRRILQTNPSNEQKVDLQMRLAEIQIERHAYLLELEIKEFNELHDKWRTSHKGSEPAFKTDRSTTQLLVAITALRTVTTQFPNHARAPEALFNLGFLLSQMNSDSATLYFEKLVKSYPKSEFVPDAHLAIGEAHFAKLAWVKAQESYQKVLAFKGTRAYPYAVYKLGWTYVNLPQAQGQQQNLVKSLSAFKLVVKLSDAADAEKTTKGLRKESLKDMVLVFAEIGDVAAAQRYFESLGEKELYFTLLERLAWQHTEAGRYGEAAGIYQRLITEAPGSKHLPTYYSKLADMNEKQQQRAQLIKTLQTAATTLADGGAWMKKNGKDTDALRARDALLGKETRVWAQRFHQEAQKLKRDASYDDALACYDIYLARAGELADSYIAHFYRAEIYVQKGKMLEAADEYMKVAALDEQFSLKGKHTQGALRNAIVALDTVLAKAQAPKLPDAGKASSPIPLTNLHARVVKAIDAYVRLFPNETDTLAFSHRAASIVFAFGDYKSANVRWTAITKSAPTSKEAETGARLVVKVPVDKQDWPTAISEARKFLAVPGVKDTKLAADLTVVLKGSVFQEALVLEKAEKRAEAAALFLAYHKEFQTDADAPKALFNAANNKFRLGKMDEAIAHLQTLIAQYPTSELAPNVLYLIASSYDALGQFAESAQSQEQLAAEYPKLDAAPEALLRATVQRNAIGDNDKAVKDANAFIAQYPTHKEVWQAYAQAGMAHGKLGDDTMAAKTLAMGAEIMARSKNANGVYLYGKAAAHAHKAGDLAMTQKNLQAGVALHAAIGAEKQKDNEAREGARLIGETQLALLDAQVTDVYKKQITDGMKLTEQFTKVRDEVGGLTQKYVAVAKLGNAESGIGALYRVAEMQEFLASILLKAPVPAGAKPEEVEQFRGTLERIALPLQEEATNLYVKAWERASETEAITPFTRRLQEKLAVLRPGDFTKVVEDMPAPSYYASDVTMTKETRQVFRD